MPPVLAQAFKEVGLSTKESLVLCTLLEHGAMLASFVARSTKLNRTTTYGILKELTEKGLVSSAKKGGGTRYQSIAPESLPGYIERRREALAESKKGIEEMIPQIKLLRSKANTLPKVQFFEGKTGVQEAYFYTLETNKEKKLRNIVGIEGVYTKLDQKFVREFLKKRLSLGIKEEYVTPDSEAAREYKKNGESMAREGKFIPEKYAMDTEISIYDNRVSIFSFALENPVALIIEDETIARTMKTIFAYMGQKT